MVLTVTLQIQALFDLDMVISRTMLPLLVILLPAARGIIMTAVSDTAVNGSLSLACYTEPVDVRGEVEPAIHCERTIGCMGASSDATGSHPFTLCICPSDLSPQNISMELASVLYVRVYGVRVPGKQHLSQTVL